MGTPPEDPTPDSPRVDERANRLPVVDVAVAVLWRQSDHRVRVLLTRRPEHVHLPGMWELPGGKLREGETAVLAVVREVQEELGLPVRDPQPLISTHHDYAERSVRLHAFLAAAVGERIPQPRGIAEYRWVDLGELADYELPPANEPITRAILDRFGGNQPGSATAG